MIKDRELAALSGIFRRLLIYYYDNQGIRHRLAGKMDIAAIPPVSSPPPA